jgi:hypothetical protein
MDLIGMALELIRQKLNESFAAPEDRAFFAISSIRKGAVLPTQERIVMVLGHCAARTELVRA